MIADDVILGEGVRIHHPDQVNLYGCTLGDHCNVGSFVEIRRGVTIGARTKIQAFVFVPEGVSIGEGCFLGPHACFTNDLFPRAVGAAGEPLGAEDWEQVETRVEDGASVGANATIRCGVTLGRGCMVGAGAVVLQDVAPYAVVAGNPARVIGDARERR